VSGYIGEAVPLPSRPTEMHRHLQTMMSIQRHSEVVSSFVAQAAPLAGPERMKELAVAMRLGCAEAEVIVVKLRETPAARASSPGRRMVGVED
jgi:hypothetical protein